MVEVTQTFNGSTRKEVSKPIEVEGGVSKGSVLGPVFTCTDYFLIALFTGDFLYGTT